MRIRLLLTIAACASGLACNSPGPRLNAPPHGDAEETSDLQGTYTYMTDNAMLADMNMCDMHFIPHRAILTSLGEERLCRMAQLMKEFGGTLRFSSNLGEDDPLRGQRVDTLVQFLTETGIPATAESVKLDGAGGRGMDASAAVLIKATEGTYRPKRSGAGSGGTSNGSGTDSSQSNH